MIVKRCTSEDIDRVYPVEEASFADPIKKDTFIKDLSRDSYYCYALFEDSVKAFISFEKVFDEGQIISVATMPDFRKKGMATTLFKEVIILAKGEGINLFTLEVRCDNYPAISLYKQFGFKEVGVRKNYYQNPTSDALLMDLFIT